MLGLGLAHHCPICGMDVEKERGIKRFGKYFCSEPHAVEYTERRMNNEQNSGYGSGGGCC